MSYIITTATWNSPCEVLNLNDYCFEHKIFIFFRFALSKFICHMHERWIRVCEQRENGALIHKPTYTIPVKSPNVKTLNWHIHLLRKVFTRKDNIHFQVVAPVPVPLPAVTGAVQPTPNHVLSSFHTFSIELIYHKCGCLPFQCTTFSSTKMFQVDWKSYVCLVSTSCSHIKTMNIIKLWMRFKKLFMHKLLIFGAREARKSEKEKKPCQRYSINPEQSLWCIVCKLRQYVAWYTVPPPSSTQFE